MILILIVILYIILVYFASPLDVKTPGLNRLQLILEPAHPRALILGLELRGLMSTVSLSLITQLS